ncbi:hypothetical protein L6452_14487 [Arctium lappa]|uniref:Uncharacterized protein n=1 Tax=Arctium lappa TaxID=4217 RepID=A0ACB9CLE8_ARCLA|nr:hypothetical protein L6452_14487 [Arctium lappa]
MEIRRHNQFQLLDGEFRLEGKRKSEAKALVTSSFGNLKSEYTDKFRFKSKLNFKDQGTRKELNQRIKRRSKIRITDENGKLIQSLQVRITYPLKFNIETGPGSDADTSVMKTMVVQGRSEKFYGVDDSRIIIRSTITRMGLVVMLGRLMWRVVMSSPM